MSTVRFQLYFQFFAKIPPSDMGQHLTDDSLSRCERRLSSLGPPLPGEGVQICTPPPPPLQIQKLSAPWWEPRASKGSLFLSCSSRSEYSFSCCACLQGFCVPSYYLSDSFDFIFSKFLQSATVECILNSQSEFSLVVGIHFVSPFYDPSRLTGRRKYIFYRKCL